MKGHPGLTTALAITTLLVVFGVSRTLASADLGRASGIAVGLTFAVFGGLSLGYLWILRRRTLKL